MLQPIMHVLNSKKIVLASSSPRRQELVKNIVCTPNLDVDLVAHAYSKFQNVRQIGNHNSAFGLSVKLCPSFFEENLDPNSFTTVADFVEETALQKVLEVNDRLIAENDPADLIIGADTVVTLEGNIFGKPKNEQEAYSMLSQLSGRGHTVYTGVVVKSGPKVIKFTEQTNVFFGELSKEQILGYISTGEPLDKAGGYGIQGIGGTLVKRIEGDYFTVMGLPLYRLSTVLRNLLINEK